MNLLCPLLVEYPQGLCIVYMLLSIIYVLFPPSLHVGNSWYCATNKPPTHLLPLEDCHLLLWVQQFYYDRNIHKTSHAGGLQVPGLNKHSSIVFVVITYWWRLCLNCRITAVGGTMLSQAHTSHMPVHIQYVLSRILLQDISRMLCSEPPCSSHFHFLYK